VQAPFWSVVVAKSTLMQQHMYYYLNASKTDAMDILPEKCSVIKNLVRASL
jgi:hypothetical protein